MSKENIENKFLNAAKWSTITELVAKIITPITNMILARIISPEAFGVIATITMIISFADMFTDAGFQKYLVQHEFENETMKYRYADVAFWTNLLISILLWTFIILFRNNIALLVGNQGLGNVIAIASVQLPLTSFSSIQMALYRRNFNFKTLFLVRMISISIPFFITIPLAKIGFSYWALILGNIITQLLNVIILTIKSKWKPKFFYKVKVLREMISFSIWSLIEAISIWLSVWIDVFIISSSLNEYYLGVYKTSTSMVNSLMALITASVLPVFFSTLSRLQNNNEKFNEIYLRTQRIISILVFPIGIGIYLYSDLATKIMLGNKWGEASVIVGVWALTTSIKMVLGDLCSEVYRAKGRPKVSFLAQILHLVVLVPVCIISSKYGFLILVYARSWIRIQFIIVHLIIMKYIILFPVNKIFKNILPSVVAASLMGILGGLIKNINIGLIWDLFSILICIIFYFICLFIFPSIRENINLIISRNNKEILKENIKKM